jgi:hypothetical protein
VPVLRVKGHAVVEDFGDVDHRAESLAPFAEAGDHLVQFLGHGMTNDE